VIAATGIAPRRALLKHGKAQFAPQDVAIKAVCAAVTTMRGGNTRTGPKQRK
jgi:hypothetical protein